MLTRRRLYVEGSVTHIMGNLSRCRSVLCTASVAFRLCWAVQISWWWDKLRQLPAVPELMPPAWPCLYLKVLALITSVLNCILESECLFLLRYVPAPPCSKTTLPCRHIQLPMGPERVLVPSRPFPMTLKRLQWYLMSGKRQVPHPYSGRRIQGNTNLTV